MSFPRYPKYKPSGVEWLGNVPEGWVALPLKRVVDPARQITYGIVQAGPHVPDGVPYIRPADMTTEDGIKAPDEIMRTSDDIAANYTRSTIRAGDIVCSIGPSFGKVMITPEWLDGANLTQGTARIAVQREHNSRYIFWTLRAPASVGQWVSSVGGATFSALNLGPLAKTTILIPPLAEQTAIAEFLDRETGKIDGLVAEQRRLMELLKEKRQAVISHAVTKGLNPHAPMKPSGIEWLGQVPEHWEMMSLKRDLDYLTSGSRGWAENYSDNGELFIRIANLTRGTIGLDLSDIQRVAVPEGTEGSRTKVRPGDVLFSITAYLGSVAVVPDGLESAYVSQHIALARLRKARLSSKWVGFVALSVVGQTWFDTKSYGGTKVQLSLDDVRDLPLPVPSLVEQNAIVELLEIELLKFDTLTAEAHRAIDLLQERRTALISAAVTGQIDVRQQNRN
jgi:type I restriction enzyme S subunit